MHLTNLFTDVLNDLRRPEYTGENRCIPCTAVNLLLTTVLAAVVGLWTTPTAGVGVFLVGLSAIYFRGYLIPGTPTLTKRYFPESMLKLFDQSAHSPVGAADEAFDPLTALSELGVVVDGPDDLALDPAFERAWDARLARRDIHALRLDDFATLFELDVADLDVRYHGDDACTVYLDTEWLGQWESAAAFNADVAAALVLSEQIPEWREIPVTRQSELLAALRICLDTCPVCRGTVGLGTETVESCCRSVDVIAASCADCGTRLFEAEFDPAAFGADS